MTICNHVWVEEDYGYLCTACGLVDPCFEGERRYDPDDWNENEDWNDDEEWFDCGWVRGVGCTLAGTESCDFDCPFREENHRGLALTRARLAKRAARHQDAKND